MNKSEYKIIFTGPMGAGKTTAIGSISDIPPVQTESFNNDQEVHSKATTTVALDFGQIKMDSEYVVNLYGTPGQERFSYMWDLLADGAMGVIILIDGSRDDAKDQLLNFTKHFAGISSSSPIIIGLGYHSNDVVWDSDTLSRTIYDEGYALPIFTVDVRAKEDVTLMVDTILCLIEAAEE
ncbi:hypothetical protein TDB9533_04340 [Thalassocella blandensis]|nr:hypothetical protein TDB9533_04340 [Thalassocella blandensis]